MRFAERGDALDRGTQRATQAAVQLAVLITLPFVIILRFIVMATSFILIGFILMALLATIAGATFIALFLILSLLSRLWWAGLGLRLIIAPIGIALAFLAALIYGAFGLEPDYRLKRFALVAAWPSDLDAVYEEMEREREDLSTAPAGQTRE